MSTAAVLEAYLDPRRSLSHLRTLQVSWQDRQLEDLLAVLAILTDHPQATTRSFGSQGLERLLALPEDVQRRLVSLPSLAAWQRMAAFVAANNPRATDILDGTGFQLDHFFRYVFAAAVCTHSAIAEPLPLQAGERVGLPGTGLKLRLEADGEVTFDGEALHVHAYEKCESVRLDETPAPDAPWGTPSAVGDGWVLWRHPMLWERIEVEPRDLYLTRPFEHECRFIDPSPDEGRELYRVFQRAVGMLDPLWPEVQSEICQIDQHVLWVSNPEQPDEVNSFSDNSVPGTLYFSMSQTRGPLPPEDVLDSLVHEHLHQKLYLLEASTPLYDPLPGKTFTSPWRVDPRPIGGVFHGYFVFYGLRSLWNRALAFPELSTYASRRVQQIARQLEEAREILARHAIFTPTGAELFAVMSEYTP